MPLAEELINQATAVELAAAVEHATGAAAPNLRAAGTALTTLPLRARSDLLRDALLADVPGDFAALAAAVRTSAPSLKGWMVWPVTTAVAERGVSDGSTAAFDDAMALLAELTGLLTAEFALRTLLRHDVDRALFIIVKWTGSADPAVRRLASEGTRPYLPWAVRVPQILSTPGVMVPVLDALYRDPDTAVRRSVANHLNDLSRDHPDLVVDTAARWLAAPDENTPGLVRHALRTLVKRGEPTALALLGFGAVSVSIDGPVLSRSAVPFGGDVEFRVTVSNDGEESARLAIDYAVHHRKANGAQVAKVFKLTTKTLAPGEALTVTKVHSFRPITTRRYYPGPHAVDVRVNGMISASTEFDLLPD